MTGKTVGIVHRKKYSDWENNMMNDSHIAPRHQIEYLVAPKIPAAPRYNFEDGHFFYPMSRQKRARRRNLIQSYIHFRFLFRVPPRAPFSPPARPPKSEYLDIGLVEICV